MSSPEPTRLRTHPMKLVTIVGEALAREPLRKLLAETGAQGCTMFAVEGDGRRGRRAADIQEFANIQIEVIVPPPVAERLLGRLEQEFFPQFGMVAY